MSEANYQAWDDLFDSGKATELLPLLRDAEKNDGSNPELLWRLARTIFEIGTGQESNDAKKENYEEALAVASKAVEVAPDHWGGYKWKGICLGYLGDFVTTNEKIGNSFIIKDCFLEAEKRTPTDGTIKHALGKWCFNVASIGMVERALAATLFATPPTSSYQEAIDYYLAADKIMESQLQRYAGVYSTNCLNLGLTYEATKDTNTAKVWFNKCVDLPVTGSGVKAQKDNQAAAKARIEAINSSWW
jgi:tetratricopeptide (TPR) repeat protein